MHQGYLNFQRDYFKLAAIPFKIEHVSYEPRKKAIVISDHPQRYEKLDSY